MAGSQFIDEYKRTGRPFVEFREWLAEQLAEARAQLAESGRTAPNSAMVPLGDVLAILDTHLSPVDADKVWRDILSIRNQ